MSPIFWNGNIKESLRIVLKDKWMARSPDETVVRDEFQKIPY